MPSLHKSVATRLHAACLRLRRSRHSVAGLTAGEIFIVRYDTAAGGQRTLAAHRDGSIFI